MPRPFAVGAAPFTPQERDLIRREMGQHFGQYPGLADGIYLRAWHSGPLKGQARVPLAVQSLLDRGLVEIGPDRIGWKATFTEAGVQALRALAQDRRALDPARYPRLRAELGLDDAAETAAAD
jgi:hypothetical protein